MRIFWGGTQKSWEEVEREKGLRLRVGKWFWETRLSQSIFEHRLQIVGRSATTPTTVCDARTRFPPVSSPRFNPISFHVCECPKTASPQNVMSLPSIIRFCNSALIPDVLSPTMEHIFCSCLTSRTVTFPLYCSISIRDPEWEDIVPELVPRRRGTVCFLQLFRN